MSATAAQHALWKLGRLRFLTWEQQKPIYDEVKQLPTTVDTAVILCARQFGKSVLGVLLAVEDCLQNPDVLVMIIGPEVAQTGDIVRPRMRMLMKSAPPGLIRYVKSERCWYFANGSELRYSGFDLDGSVNTRGKTVYKIYLEEVGFSHPDKYHDFIRSDLSPALLHSPNAKIFYLTTLPKIADHPFVTETIPYSQISGYFKSYTLDDNIALSPEQKAKAIRMAGGIDSPECQREYYNRIIRDATILLVPEFEEERHVKEFSIPQHANFWVSGDYGGSRDKTVFHLNAWDFDRGRHLIVDERAFDNNTPTRTIMEAVKEMEAPWLSRISHRWVDAPGQVQVDMANEFKYPTAIPKKNEDMEAGVRVLRTAFSQDSIEIHPRCVFTITSLRSGTWNKTRTDFERTAALGHCDGIASLVYGRRHRNEDNPYPRNFGFRQDNMVRQSDPADGHALKSLIPGD